MSTFDLSHPLDSETWVYPGDAPVALETRATVEADGYRVTDLSFGTHAGTHVDAPAHVFADGRTLDEFPPEAFAFEAALVDLADLGAREPIRLDRLRESAPDTVGGTDTGDGVNGDGVDALVLRTGWDDHWNTDRYADHPYLSEPAAAWCAERGFHVALDAPSVDPTPSPNAGDEPEGVPAHRALLGADRLVVENLTGLDALPERFELRAYPLPIRGVDGAPTRAVGVVDAV